MSRVIGERDLVPVIVQDRLTGQLLRFAQADHAALASTVETGNAAFHRSADEGPRSESGTDTFHVTSVIANGEGTVVIFLADPLLAPSADATCNFVQRLRADGTTESIPDSAAPFLEDLGREIESRKASTGTKSYTRYLLDGGAERVCAKIREEASELAEAISSETDDRVLSEAADVLYHVMVGLAGRGLGLRQVLDKLAARSGTSGHVEKARRG